MRTKNYIYEETQYRFKAVSIQVSYTISINQLAMYFTAVHTDEAIEKIKTVSENEFMKTVKNELKCCGEDRAGYLIGDMNLQSACDEVEMIINERFIK